MIKNRGFTLIELMVTVSILAILTTVAIPGFSDLIRNTQAKALANGMVTALQFARSEAVKRNQQVNVCPGGVIVGCTAAPGTWVDGWVVYVNGTATALRTWDAPEGVVVIDQTGADAEISFLGTGRVNVATQIEASLSDCSGNEKRIIDVTAIGRVSLSRTGC
ncbi:GspH/FimT family pseudopilin [Neptunomonas antarctica]|uniref:Type II secretion system protein H n=1 Tax=Neptunomonas antarctica TaxID=619304 RepID=A0A1N7MGS9_9GAMM|nr:GspH/FimT family pseudopilin [Neptunomonas antarctica]SIS85230.1 type IV fimbrial biogenesis protein FimT [Neptunomonas antarctica]